MTCGFAGSTTIVLVSPVPCTLTTCLSLDLRLPAAWPSCVVQLILSLIILSTVGYESSAWMLGSHCDAAALVGRAPLASPRSASITSTGYVDAGRICATSGSG